MTSFLPPAILEIKANATQAIASFKQVNAELAQMEGQATATGTSLTTLEKSAMIAKAALVAVGAAGVAYLGYAVKAAMEQEKATASLETAMRNAGVASEENKQKFDAVAKSMVNLGFQDDEAAKGFGVLVTATKDVSESTKLMALAADFARKKHISLEEASTTLVRASTGNVKAFKAFGITLDSTLPKQEAINQAFDELNQRIGGSAQAYAKTFAGQMAVLHSEFENTAETVGLALIPVLTNFLKIITAAFNWVKENKNALAALVLVVGTAYAAYKTYTTILLLTQTYQKIQIALSLAQASGIGKVKAAQLLLNDAMRKNPIGLIVTALFALSAAFVWAWNKFDWFRKGIVKGLQIIVNAIGYLIGMYGTLFKAMSKLPVIGGAFKGVSNFLNDAANNVRKFSDGLDKLAEKSPKAKKKTEDTVKYSSGDFATDSGKSAKDAAKQVEKNNRDYMKIISSLNKKVEEAKQKFTDKMISLEKNYQEKVTDLNKNASEKIAKLTKDAEDKKAKAKEETAKKILEAQTKFNETMASLNKKREEDNAKAALNNQEKIAEITQKSNEKLRSIVQQSIDRLRNAYERGTSFDIGDLFKNLAENGEVSANQLLDVLKKKLTDAKTLAENASKLAGLGFTQTFIEQVVSQGPEVGNQLAQSIFTSTPDVIKELQNTFMSLEDTSQSALDKLGSTMSTSTSFATAELADLYSQTQKELSYALQEQSKDYADAQTELTKSFNENMLEAEKTRDEAIKSLQLDLADTIEEINKNLQEGIAEVNADLKDSLTEAYKDFVDAQTQAKKDLADALSSIEADFKEKLGGIKDAIGSTVLAINSLKSAMSSASSYGTSYGTTAPTGGISSTPYVYDPRSGNMPDAPVVNNNVVVNAPQATSPTQIGSDVISAIKYGLPSTISANSPRGQGMIRGADFL